jgi:HSP20 family protein
VDTKPSNPWEQFEQTQREMNELLDRFLQQLGSREEAREISFIPAIDLWETDSDLVVVVELAGVLEEDVDLWVSPSCVVVRGLRPGVPRGRPVIREWRWGEFEREVQLPEQIDPETMRASYSEGILEIRLKKREEP